MKKVSYHCDACTKELGGLVKRKVFNYQGKEYDLCEQHYNEITNLCNSFLAGNKLNIKVV